MHRFQKIRTEKRKISALFHCPGSTNAVEEILRIRAMYKTLVDTEKYRSVLTGVYVPYTTLGKTKIYYFCEDLGVFGPNNNVRLLWKKIDGDA